MPAREVASQDLVTVDPETSLSEALQLMASYQVGACRSSRTASDWWESSPRPTWRSRPRRKTTGELVEHISRPPDGPRL